MSEPDPADRRNTLPRRLDAAQADARVARMCLEMAPPQPGVAAYHFQQAAEKVLKGLLVLADVDFRKTHDLDALGASVVVAYPALEPLVAPVRAWTGWGVAYQYPDAPNPPEPQPSAEQMTAALAHIARLADALEAHVARLPAQQTATDRPGCAARSTPVGAKRSKRRMVERSKTRHQSLLPFRIRSASPLKSGIA